MIAYAVFAIDHESALFVRAFETRERAMALANACNVYQLTTRPKRADAPIDDEAAWDRFYVEMGRWDRAHPATAFKEDTSWTCYLRFNVAPVTVELEAWDDQEDDYTARVREAHPIKTGRHDLYKRALELIGHRHSKFALVELVNAFLVEIERRRLDSIRLNFIEELLQSANITACREVDGGIFLEVHETARKPLRFRNAAGLRETIDDALRERGGA